METSSLQSSPLFIVNLLLNIDLITDKCIVESKIKGAGRSADLKINKSAPLSLNHHNFSNTELIYTK